MFWADTALAFVIVSLALALAAYARLAARPADGGDHVQTLRLEEMMRQICYARNTAQKFPKPSQSSYRRHQVNLAISARNGTGHGLYDFYFSMWRLALREKGVQELTDELENMWKA